MGYALYPRPMSDDRLSTSEQEIVDDAMELAATVIDPNADRWEQDRVFAAEAFAAAAKSDLTALLVPEELGGRGVGEVTLARMMEELAAADLAAAFSLVVHNNMARGVAGSGNAHLIETVLPVLISGERLGAFLLTEPGVGSDAAAITCSAELDGETWVINGEKAWVTNASDAALLNLYAQTDPSLGHRGIVSIVVDTELRGVVRGPAYELMGAHAMGTGGFEFSDVRVGVENTLIPVGQAFGAAMVGIDLARVLVAAMCCGLMRRSLDTAIAATERAADLRRFGVGQARSSVDTGRRCDRPGGHAAADLSRRQAAPRRRRCHSCCSPRQEVRSSQGPRTYRRLHAGHGSGGLQAH